MKKNKAWNSIIKDVGEKGQVLIAVNAFGNVDTDKDISMPGSFTKTIAEFSKRRKWFLNHNSYGDNYLLGVEIESKENGKYLEVLGQLNLEKQISRDIYTDYKLYAEYGKTLEHSIGVNAIKYEFDEEQEIRRVFEWKWWEFSTLTSWGANEDTPLLGIKNLKTQKDYIEHINFLEKALKSNYTDERLQEIENTINELKSLIETEPQTHSDDNEPVERWISECKLFKI